MTKPDNRDESPISRISEKAISFTYNRIYLHTTWDAYQLEPLIWHYTRDVADRFATPASLISRHSTSCVFFFPLQNIWHPWSWCRVLSRTAPAGTCAPAVDILSVIYEPILTRIHHERHIKVTWVVGNVFNRFLYCIIACVRLFHHGNVRESHYFEPRDDVWKQKAQKNRLQPIAGSYII